MSGPPRKPSVLKLIAGTYRPDRSHANEPRPEVEIPPMPPHLSEEAKQEWARVSRQLYDQGLLASIDRAVLAAYCECWSDWVDACKMCATKDGQDRKVIKTSKGNFIENPYFSVKKRMADMLHKFGQEFGMSAAARTRIDAGPLPGGEGSGNPFENLG